MPSGLFRADAGRSVFAGPTPEIFKGYTGDHVDLLVRYMFQLTPDEQSQLLRILPRAAAGSGSPAVAMRTEAARQ